MFGLPSCCGGTPYWSNLPRGQFHSQLVSSKLVNFSIIPDPKTLILWLSTSATSPILVGQVWNCQVTAWIILSWFHLWKFFFSLDTLIKRRMSESPITRAKACFLLLPCLALSQKELGVNAEESPVLYDGKALIVKTKKTHLENATQTPTEIRS